MSNVESSIIDFCPFCGSRLNEVSTRCPACGGALDQFHANQSIEDRIAYLESKQHLAYGMNPGLVGMEYRSRLTLFGWPLLHIATGMDPETGKRRVARGLVAIGNIAIGGIALGGIAMGGVTLGGMSIGVMGLGGFCIGLLLAVGGMAVGCGLSLGGCAVGTIAIGGTAIGYYSLGGMALGQVAFGGNVRNPNALLFFKSWNLQTAWLFGMLRPVVISLAAASLLMIPLIRSTESEARQIPDSKKPNQSGSIFGLLILILLGVVFGITAIWLVLLLLHFVG